MIHKACPDHKLVLNRSGARETQTIGVHAIRGGGVFGEHEVRFIGEHEELYIGHRAFSRELFADGALRLGQQLFKSHKTGFIRLEDWQDPEVH